MHVNLCPKDARVHPGERCCAGDRTGVTPTVMTFNPRPGPELLLASGSVWRRALCLSILSDGVRGRQGDLSSSQPKQRRTRDQGLG